MNKLITLLFIIVALFGLVFLGTIFIKDKHYATSNKNEPIATATQAEYIPTQLEIPAIGVKSSVEQVGLTPKKEMDTPKNYDNVGWYKLGYYPFDKGNMVISGHLDKTDGTPAAFWNLAKLKKGDEIIVHAKETMIIYVVSAVATYSAKSFPIQKVFGPSDSQNLNLITCEGTYITGVGYNQRLVVYSSIKDVNR